MRKSTAYMQRHLNVSSNIAQREELQVTVMLIVIVIVFFLCQAPYVGYTAVNSIKKYTVSDSIILIYAVT